MTICGDFTLALACTIQFLILFLYRVGVGSPGHPFSSGSPVQTDIFAILKNLGKNLYIVCVQF